jgi:anti-anti-sigma regulatory factor
MVSAGQHELMRRGHVRLVETDDLLVLIIEGDADAIDGADLHRLIDRAARDPKSRPVEADFSAVTYLDDTRIIGLLLYAANLLEDQHRRFWVQSPSAAARQALTAMAIDRLLEIAD